VKLRLTPRALRDLNEIADYIRERSAQGASSVRTAILNSLQLLTSHPELGRAQSIEQVRKLVTRRYGYIVYYSVDRASQEIAVLTIRHPSREQPYSDR
jgi:addiction module RelE/StbE family toxin